MVSFHIIMENLRGKKCLCSRDFVKVFKGKAVSFFTATILLPAVIDSLVFEKHSRLLETTLKRKES